MADNINKSLEKLVGSVDYRKYENGYVPSKFAIGFVNFIKMVEGNKVENKTPLFHYDILDTIKNSKNTLIVSFRGSAKALPLNTLILTPEGKKKIKDLHVGDKVYDGIGKKTSIVVESEVFFKEMMEITLDNGMKFETSMDHLNIVYRKGFGRKPIREVLSSFQLYGRVERYDFFIPLIEKALVYDSYMERSYIADWKEEAKKFLNKVQDNRLYLENRPEFRIKLLKGLVDYKGGNVDNYWYVVVTKEVLQDVIDLVQELGGKCWVEYFKSSQKYWVKFRLQRSKTFYLNKKYKEDYLDAFRWDQYYKITNIRRTGKYKECKCIGVKSGTHSYLIENAILTHNTTLTAEYLILYLAVYGNLEGFGDVSVGMYIGDTMDNGVKNLRNNLEFRYNHSDFLQRFIPKVKFTDPEWEFTNIDGHNLTIKGFGCTPLALNTTLYTESGTTTIGDCKVGDRIYGANGKLATIVDKSEVFNKSVYRIHLIDGRYLDVTHDHINHVIHKCRNYSKYKDTNLRYEEKDLTTIELLDIPLKVTGKSEYTLYIPTCTALEYPEVDLGIDPYTLGLLLGDGQLKDDGSCILTAEVKDIKELGLRGKHSYDKFIPEICFRMSKEQRLSLLQGLIDTDGTISPRKTTYKSTYYTVSESLAKGVQRLVWSLGGYAIVSSREAYKKALGNRRYYMIGIHLNEYISRLPRKRDRILLNNSLNTRVAITSIEKIKTVPTQCIAVDNEDHLFIAGDYIVTHNTGVRGFKKYGERPQIAILDDLMSDKSAESKTITKDIENIIYKAVRQAMHPTRRKTIWIGTPFNKSDPLYKAAGTSSWVSKAFPICEKFPCTKEEFIGAWEDRFPYEAVKDEYDMLKENGRIDAFNQELMLRILSDEDRLVLDEDIIWYSRKDFIKNIEKCNIYITTDFATSETQNSDYSVISVWALDWKGVFHWIDGIVKRQDMAKNIDDLFRFAEMYKPLITGIEISGQQRGFIPWIKKEMVDRKYFFYLASDKASGEEGLRPNTSKLTRFNVVLPLFKQRKIAFPEELKEAGSMLEFIDELSSATPSGFKSVHDDCIDTVSQLAMIEYFVPSDSNVVVVKKEIKNDNNYNMYYFTEPNSDDGTLSSYIV